MSQFINPDKEKLLTEKMLKFGIKETDITEKFVRSGGHGGQHLNKTSTCVYLKHTPTGIEVKCEISRNQSVNRFLARRILVNKIEESALEIKSAERQRIEKIKRQKRKRSKRAKEKILRLKKIISEKKQLREKIIF
ncbi:MAG: Peptide chain release factor 2 [Elusimicrobia bacterium ADurb.Bin231]|nr:MAG: Peptide chain release factor 2 [Elusimicrobia bacterium ADurb.Bin231]